MSNLHENSNDRINSSSKEISENQLKEEELIIIWINELKDEEKRSKAISKLSHYYDKNQDLPIYLWYSQGTMTIILQEIIGTYKYLSLNKFPLEKANKIYNILLLLTSIASHKEIRSKFIESKMPIFLYPFLKNTSTAKQNEYIKLLTLTVISTLIKSEDPETISFFISTQIIPILLKIIDKGPLLSKLSAGIMIHLIVKADEGLKFICEEKMRYSAIILFMRQMLKNKNNQKIIDITLRTFIRLAANNEARIIIKNNLLKEINDQNFTKHLNQENQLLINCLLRLFNEKDKVNKVKEVQKENNKININYTNITSNNNNNIQQNNNNGEAMNYYNINNNNNNNNNLMMVNQMKLSPSYMMANNYNDVNNFNMYNNGNENYLNKMNYLGSQNNNKQFMNMNYYNMYKGS